MEKNIQHTGVNLCKLFGVFLSCIINHRYIAIFLGIFFVWEQ